MNDGGDQVAVGRQHEPAKLGENGDVTHVVGGQDLLIFHPHALTDDADVASGLLGAVVHADAAGQVDEGNMRAGGVAQPHRQTEQLPGQSGVVFIGGCVGGKEGVNAEVLRAQLHQPGDGPCHLVFGHAVFGVPGHVHDGVAKREGTARVIPQTHRLGDRPHGCQKIHIGGIVQIDVHAHIPRLAHIQFRGDVGGKDHVVSRDAHGLGQQQLGIGGAVAAAALLVEDFQQEGVGGGLDGKILPESGIPGKRRLQQPGVGADAGLVVNVKGGGDLLADFLCFFQSQKRYLFHSLNPL